MTLRPVFYTYCTCTHSKIILWLNFPVKITLWTLPRNLLLQYFYKLAKRQNKESTDCHELPILECISFSLHSTCRYQALRQASSLGSGNTVILYRHTAGWSCCKMFTIYREINKIYRFSPFPVNTCLSSFSYLDLKGLFWKKGNRLGLYAISLYYTLIFEKPNDSKINNLKYT